MTPPVILTPGPAELEVTYEGIDGSWHYAKVTHVHEDGTVTWSRGYYGDNRQALPATARSYRWHARIEVRAA